ncbi:hypothetical protein BS47DRAFT_116493 [Hydnum rufescens UP504]|uniref:Uncharacterized protein n=1 Tax=Hydnum rufescens UP504 TaxID=1448309 RepID=A0A9P6DSU9_9AGAM|nr:hypothetical protein BS47DRAFT_116493 [Hydnum rufescens UP504]
MRIARGRNEYIHVRRLDKQATIASSKTIIKITERRVIPSPGRRGWFSCDRSLILFGTWTTPIYRNEVFGRTQFLRFPMTAACPHCLLFPRPLSKPNFGLEC